MSSPTPLVASDRLSAFSRLGRYLRQVYHSRHSVLQYDRTNDILSTWIWPADLTGMRVPPAGLLEHCVSNNHLGPCCLCPLKDATKPDFVEASFELAGAGVLSGEYVVKCAEDYCGYIVPIQRIYGFEKFNHLFRRMPPARGPGPAGPSGGLGLAVAARADTPTTPSGVATSPLTTIPELLNLNLAPGKRLKRSFARLNFDDMFTIPVFQALEHRATETEILLKLDDYSQPGLYEEEFRELLGRMAKCSCGMVMAQRVFKQHRCSKGIYRPLKKRKTNVTTIDIIDLTED